jgi:hypothetical protein
MDALPSPTVNASTATLPGCYSSVSSRTLQDMSAGHFRVSELVLIGKL